jgi:uncharacterized protein with FMN-binding domain
MKRVMSLVIAASVTLSLSACRAGGVGTRNNNNNANNGGTATNQGNTGRLRNTSYNNNNNAKVNVNYKDGTYTGYSDGNESATVVVRNGRIVNIDLNRVGQQGTDIGRTINKAAGTEVNAINIVKTSLITAMIQNQDSEVNIKYNNNNNDINTRNAVDNWKLAVRRALDQARR